MFGSVFASMLFVVFVDIKFVFFCLFVFVFSVCVCVCKNNAHDIYYYSMLNRIIYIHVPQSSLNIIFFL